MGCAPSSTVDSVALLEAKLTELQKELQERNHVHHTPEDVNGSGTKYVDTSGAMTTANSTNYPIPAVEAGTRTVGPSTSDSVWIKRLAEYDQILKEAKEERAQLQAQALRHQAELERLKGLVKELQVRPPAIQPPVAVNAMVQESDPEYAQVQPVSPANLLPVPPFKPPRLCEVSWKIPMCTESEITENPAGVEVGLEMELASLDPDAMIPLPPSHPLQVLESIVRWRNVGGKPSALPVPPCAPSIRKKETGKFILHASGLSTRLPDRAHPDPEQKRGALIVDASPETVQCGRFVFSAPGGEATSEPLQVTFHTPFVVKFPQVFCCISGLGVDSRSSTSTEQWTCIKATHANAEGFKVVQLAGSAQEKLLPNASITTGSISISYLAFDPRTLLQWCHGEVWIPRGERIAKVKFKIDAALGCPIPRESFTDPPLVFVGLGGGESLSTTSFFLSAEEITSAGCEIRAVSEADLPERGICVKWIAIPQQSNGKMKDEDDDEDENDEEED